MLLSQNQIEQLQNFFDASDFARQGWIITDLDGTAIHEFHGRLIIPEMVEKGLKRIYDLGRPVVINTLRFPLSVMRTFGKQWYSISDNSVPTILMNGSQLGYMTKTSSDEFAYREIAAFPLTEEEIKEVLQLVEPLVADKVHDLLVFYYPRDWTKGERIWTPADQKIKEIQDKYLSASAVYTGSVEGLKEQLLAEDICMIFLLVDIPEESLMAYQHTRKSNFFTHKGVNKLYGAQQMASYLNLDLNHALGAGDTVMDTFLTEVGLPVHVGNFDLPFQGILPPVKLKGSAELGELLFRLAAF